ncbi:MAG: MarR family transcriptional regulator [Anaerolineae bacterium]|nr:MarR family transcriptional regulator [Anaerolineae bacterium]
MDHHPSLEEMGKPLATFLLLTHTGRQIVQSLHNEGCYGELTPSQFYTLMALEHNEGMPLSEISEKIQRSPGNMTLVIDNLEKDGLVERQRSAQDRRVVVAVLTEAGRQKIAAARRAHRTAVENRLSALTDADLDTLQHILLKLNTEETGLPQQLREQLPGRP